MHADIIQENNLTLTK